MSFSLSSWMSSCLFPLIPLMLICRKVVRAIIKKIDRFIVPDESDGQRGWFRC